VSLRRGKCGSASGPRSGQLSSGPEGALQTVTRYIEKWLGQRLRQQQLLLFCRPGDREVPRHSFDQRMPSDQTSPAGDIVLRRCDGLLAHSPANRTHQVCRGVPIIHLPGKARRSIASTGRHWPDVCRFDVALHSLYRAGRRNVRTEQASLELRQRERRSAS